MFVQESVARQVRVATNASAQTRLVCVLTTVTVRFVPSAVSLALGGSNVHAVPAATVLLLAQVIIGGGLLTVHVQVSVAVTCEPHTAKPVAVRVAVKLQALAGT